MVKLDGNTYLNFTLDKTTKTYTPKTDRITEPIVISNEYTLLINDRINLPNITNSGRLTIKLDLNKENEKIINIVKANGIINSNIIEIKGGCQN